MCGPEVIGAIWDIRVVRVVRVVRVFLIIWFIRVISVIRLILTYLRDSEVDILPYTHTHTH